ncbi:DUF4872 domain-containing protein, partial [Jatrophihabitans endophyticus]|uniref:DUF4872 domain-containing protein n=1 Tax=Jatrophihabitans endophyticus TaxID=1206085 RepID=UPI0019E79022
HDIVIIGYDDDQQLVHVVDNDRTDVQLVPYDALAKARSSTSFPEPTRHTIYDIRWPDTLPDLRTAAADAFARSATTMTTPGRSAIAGPDADHTATGLTAVGGFVDDLQAWPDVFDERTLAIALAALPAFIEKAGTGGGLFRRLLSRGCEELAGHLRHPSLDTLTDAAQRVASAWTSVAATAASSDTDNVNQRARHTARTAQPLVELEQHLCRQLRDCGAQLR